MALGVGARRLVERARARHGWTLDDQTESGESELLSEDVKSRWVFGDTARALLRMTETEGVSLERAASQTGLSTARSERIIQLAKAGLGATAPPGAGQRRAAANGELARWQAATDVAKNLHQLEVSVAQWWGEAPDQCTTALRQLVRCYYRTYRDFVVKDVATLKSVLRTLKRLHIVPEQVKVIVRKPPIQAPSLPGWAVGHMGRYAGCPVRRINPQVMAKASSYAKWLGLLPLNQNGGGIGLAVVRELVLMLAGIESAEATTR